MFFASVMLPAVLLLVFNSIYNSHVHILPSGERIVHAHPFSHQPSPDKNTNHTHSQAEYDLFSVIGHVEINIAFLLAFALLLVRREKPLAIRDAYLAKQHLFAYRPVRAPPFC